MINLKVIRNGEQVIIKAEDLGLTPVRHENGTWTKVWLSAFYDGDVLLGCVPVCPSLGDAPLDMNMVREAEDLAYLESIGVDITSIEFL